MKTLELIGTLVVLFGVLFGVYLVYRNLYKNKKEDEKDESKHIDTDTECVDDGFRKYV